jgi:hypothetical protein
MILKNVWAMYSLWFKAYEHVNQLNEIYRMNQINRINKMFHN